MLAQQDIQLLYRLKQGDLTAFDELYLKYYKLLCTSAYFFLKNEQEAKDLVQTLFLDIWDKQLYEHFHDDIKGYLFRATKNRCLNHLKWQRVQYEHHKGYAEFQDHAGVSHMEGPPDSYQQLHIALNGMPGQKKAAIQMVYMHGKRYRDAADSMRISINSLKTHLKTGLKILRGEINSKMN
ncbi:MAG TPA: sigma-70 family RNA polymerase sigma factor [Puia sp.]|nr:sigma-70 family RNA polymerase sigma factor [Puia sp.]